MAAMETVGFLEIEQQKLCLIGRRIYLVGYNRKMSGPYFISLKGNSVDKKHAVIDVTPKAVSLVDLNSETGTYINGRRLKPLFKNIIRSGDKIRFGNVIGRVQINAIEEDKISNVDRAKSPDKSAVIFSSPEPESVFQKPKIPIITEIKNVFQTKVEFENINNTKRESLNIPETQPRLSNISSATCDTTKRESLNIPETQPRLSNMSSATYDNDDDDEFCVPETQEVVTAVCDFKRRNVSAARDNEDDIDFRIGTQDYFEDAAEQSACSQSSMILPKSEYLIREDVLSDENDHNTPNKTTLNTNLPETTTPPPSCSSPEDTLEKETIKDRAATCCTPDIFDCPQIDYPTAYNRKKNKTIRSLTPVDGHEKRNIYLSSPQNEDKVPMQHPDYIYQLMKANVTRELLAKEINNQDLILPTQPNIAIQQVILQQDQLVSQIMEKDTNPFGPTQPTLPGSPLPMHIKPNIITPPYDDDRNLPITQLLQPQQLDIPPTQPAPPLPDDSSPTTGQSKWNSITTTVLADEDSLDPTNKHEKSTTKDMQNITPTKSGGHNSTMKNEGTEKPQNVAAFFAEIKEKTAKRKIEADGKQSPEIEYSELTEMFQTPRIIKANFSKDPEQIRKQNEEAREKVLQYDNSDDEEEQNEIEEDIVKFYWQRRSNDFNVLMRAKNSLEKEKLQRDSATENATKDKEMKVANETANRKSIGVVVNEKSQQQESENNNIALKSHSKSIEVPPNSVKKSSESYKKTEEKSEKSLKTNLSKNVSKKRSKSAPDIEENVTKIKKKSSDAIEKVVEKPKTIKDFKEKQLEEKFKVPYVRIKKLSSTIIENHKKGSSKSIVKVGNSKDTNKKQKQETTIPPKLSKSDVSEEISISINSDVVSSSTSRTDESDLSIERTARKGRIRVDAIETVVKVQKLMSDSREMPMRRTTRLQSSREAANTIIKEINETTKQKQTAASEKQEKVENSSEQKATNKNINKEVFAAIAKMKKNVETKMNEKIDNIDVGTKTKETRKRSAETINETSKKKRTESETGNKTERDTSRNAIRKSIMEDIIEISNESGLSDAAIIVKEPKPQIKFEDTTKKTNKSRRQRAATSPNAQALAKTNSKNKLKVATTMVDPRILKTLSNASSKAAWQFTKDPTQADVLVMDRGNRTYKFLIAIARGIPIVNSSWLEHFTQTGSLPSITKFVFKDPSFEKRHRFQLLKTIDMARKKKIFTGLTFLMTPSIQPQPDEMKKIISIAGGNIQPEDVDAIKEKEKVYLITSIEDKKLWAKYRRINSQIRIITAEGVMGSIMRQVLQPLSDHLLC